MLATLVTAVVSGLHGARGRAPIRNAGFAYPASRITVNLAPADRRKHGAAYDLAIGVGILVASEQIRAGGGAWALLGELSRDGTLQAVPGVLPMVATLARAGQRRVGVPAANLEEARLVEGVEAVGLDGLDDAARLVAGPRGRRAMSAARRPVIGVSGLPAARGPGPARGAPAGAGGPASGLG